MAKKATQMRIPGTFDPPPAEVKKAATAYIEAKRQKADWLTKAKGARDQLIEAMRSNDCPEIEIDDGEKKIVLVNEDTVKIESVKKKHDD